jgi:hypothetical protein
MGGVVFTIFNINCYFPQAPQISEPLNFRLWEP